MMGVLFSLPAIRERSNRWPLLANPRPVSRAARTNWVSRCSSSRSSRQPILLFLAADLVGNEPLNNTDP